MSISPLPSLERLTLLADNWEKLKRTKGSVWFRSVADTEHPFEIKPFLLKRIFLWITLPFRKKGEILGQKIALYDQKANLVAVHKLAADALSTYFSQNIPSSELDSSIKKIIDFALAIDSGFGGDPLAATFRKTLRSLPPSSLFSPAIYATALQILQKEEEYRPKIAKTLLRIFSKNLESCPLNTFSEVLKIGLDGLKKIGPFTFDTETAALLVRRIEEGERIDGSLVASLWPHFPEQARVDLLALGLKAIDQSPTSAILEANIRELKDLYQKPEEKKNFCERILHRDFLQFDGLLFIWEELSSSFSDNQHLLMRTLIGKSIAALIKPLSLQEALGQLPDLLKKTEKIPFDFTFVRDALRAKWRESFTEITKNLQISGLKTEKQVASVHSTIQSLLQARPDFKGIPQQLAELLTNDWRGVTSELYGVIQKQLQKVALQDISSLETEKELQDALCALRSIEKSLTKDITPPDTTCLDYIHALINDLLRPLKNTSSPEHSKKKAMIATVASGLTLASMTALTTWLADGGYEDFQSAAQKVMFMDFVATIGRALASQTFSRIPGTKKIPQEVVSKIGQFFTYALSIAVPSAAGFSEPQSLLNILDYALSGTVTSTIAEYLHRPLRETTKQYLGEGATAAVLDQIGAIASFQAAGQAVTLAHAPLQSLQKAAQPEPPPKKIRHRAPPPPPAELKQEAPPKVELPQREPVSQPVPIPPQKVELPPETEIPQEEPVSQPAPISPQIELPHEAELPQREPVSQPPPPSFPLEKPPSLGFFEAVSLLANAFWGKGAVSITSLPSAQTLSMAAQEIGAAEIFSPLPLQPVSPPVQAISGGVAGVPIIQ